MHVKIQKKSILYNNQLFLSPDFSLAFFMRERRLLSMKARITYQIMHLHLAPSLYNAEFGTDTWPLNKFFL